MKPAIAVTTGDPSGIGPEIVKKALEDARIKRLAHWKIFGPMEYQKYPPRICGQISWQSLNYAAQAIKKKECQALVTAPVSKTHLSLAGFHYPGQTEFLVNCFGVKRYAMMLASEKLKIVLVTIHKPLRKVTHLVTPSMIFEKILLTHDALKHLFKIRRPRITVCGLNPHAGEGGLFGDEERKKILPAIRKARRKKMNVSGPYSADTLFYRAIHGEFDAVICMYHDQGLIPVKTLYFDEAVNTTLGLPFIRTSPDHGPAFDIAGKNLANPLSMKAAMKLAVSLYNHGNPSVIPRGF